LRHIQQSQRLMAIALSFLSTFDVCARLRAFKSEQHSENLSQLMTCEGADVPLSLTNKGGIANALHANFAVGVLTPPLTKGNAVPSGLPYFSIGDPAAS
jgi:hypothetical protein